MHRASAARRRPAFRRLLVAQGLVVLVMALVASVVSGVDALISTLAGGLVCLVPQLYFTWRLGSVRGGRQARRYVSNFYRAEAGKFGLTVALFVVVFITAPPSNPIFFFSAYVAALFVHWLAPWLLRERPTP
ncbi:ATP synthase subunit I [Halomonas sp. C05BenzN]|uniref:ATP synthase subunit I n=1 Tax=Halomonas sp. C05BenzN TaxID=3411041 RepID=UPI003B9376E3